MADQALQEDFDFDADKLKNPIPTPVPRPNLVELYKIRSSRTREERIEDLLGSLHDFTIKCSMCLLGRKYCEEHNTSFDPHVFSNMNFSSRWVVVGQNPGYNECIRHEPFIGDAGNNFNKALKKFGLSRNKFYITNCTKCHTLENKKPEFKHVEACEPILRLELAIIKPILIITLGQAAFETFCPNTNYSDSLGKIIKSEKFNVKVFPIYHPSPRNMIVPERKEKFEKDIELLCKLIKAQEKTNN